MSATKPSLSASKEPFDALAKVAVIGDSSVGKTNILLRYVNADYQMTHITTIGIDFKVKTLVLDGFRLKMQIWDTAGQERFRNLSGTIYQGAEAIILVIYHLRRCTRSAVVKLSTMWKSGFRTSPTKRKEIFCLSLSAISATSKTREK